MLVLIAAGLTALVMSAFGWLLEDAAKALDRGYDKMQKYIDAGRIDLDKTAVQGGRR